MKKLMITGILLIFSQCLWAADAPMVTTPQGKLEGTLNTNGGAPVRAFKGIPYAVPPTGVRRWQPAQPAPGWKGVRLADHFAPNCIQSPYPENSFFNRPSPLSSEDCLYLNVWTAANEGEKLPVMVWIHGGALTRGSGAISTYNGANLARKGVVVVTINYRLGVLGYFAHPELTAESPHKASGNQGTTDQIQALKWVQDNIAAFGGDPDQVTIFGESAGSWSVNHLVASPLAKGLFHRAIGESGAVLTPMPELDKDLVNQPSAESMGEKFAKAALEGQKPTLANLRAMPAGELLAAAEANRFSTQGIVDGWVFPDQIYDIMAQGKQNKVPVIVGFNSDEGTTLGATQRVPQEKDKYIAFVKKTYGGFADEYLKMYPADDLVKSALDGFRDAFVTWSMQTWAMMTANVNQPAWLYYFSHHPAGPMQDKLGAYHAAEIQYVFDNNQTDDASEQEMADIMSDYWVSFAKTGNPNKALAKENERPQWQPYTADDRNYIEFNNHGKKGAVPGQNLLPGIWAFYEKVYSATRP